MVFGSYMICLIYEASCVIGYHVVSYTFELLYYQEICDNSIDHRLALATLCHLSLDNLKTFFLETSFYLLYTKIINS